MNICGYVLLHCMFRMLRDQNLAPLNCSVSFETLIFLENSHFIEYKVKPNFKKLAVLCGTNVMELNEAQFRWTKKTFL